MTFKLKGEMRYMKKIIKGGIIIFALIFLGVYLFLILPNQKKLESLRNMKIENIDLTQVEDGLYKGEFTYSDFTYVVEVKVESQKITNINILNNRNTKYSKNAESVVAKVIQKQTLDVDVISGASTTSKALLKAIENALNSN